MNAIFHVLFEIELINLILFFIGDSFRIDWLGKWGDPNSRALIGCREKLLCITIFHKKMYQRSRSLDEGVGWHLRG